MADCNDRGKCTEHMPNSAFRMQDNQPAANGAASRKSDRRQALLGGLGIVAGLGLAGRDAVAAKKPNQLPPQTGDRLMFTKGALKNELVRPELLKAGDAQIEGFPFSVADDVLRKRNRMNRLLIIKADPAEMDEDTAALAADGVLAFSAVCTHKGCTIKSWMEQEQHLRCHCHLSEFAVLTGGSVEGGPARAPLPMLGLSIDDEGFVVVAQEFNRKPGFKS